MTDEQHDQNVIYLFEFYPINSVQFDLYKYCVIYFDQKAKRSNDMAFGNMSSLGIILSSLVPLGVVKVEI